MSIVGSILTNLAANTALQNLENTARNLQSIQGEISTGLAVSSAKDNASYFSIATVLRSDSSALGNIASNLNLGDASLGVASNALKTLVTTLGDIKNQLVNATAPDAHMDTIQATIAKDQATLQSIAGSSELNGQNFLAINSADPKYNATKSFMSSYSRDSSGAISIGFINVDTTNTALFNPNFNAATDATTTPGTGETTSVATPGGIVASTGGVTGDGISTPVPPTTTGALTFTAYAADTASGTPATNSFSTAISVANATSTSAVTDSVVAGTLTTAALATAGDVAGKVATSAAYQASESNGTLTFYVAMNTTSAAGAGAYQYHKYTVSNMAATSAGILDKADTSTVGSYTANGVTTTSAATGTGVSVMGIDISQLTNTPADLAKLNAFEKQVDAALTNTTSATAALGASQAQIEAQASFVTSLQSSIKDGVGTLVDADLNVASTRLQALQVQQQLGVQSLSIANQSSQMILKLFG
jgi:flagellin